MIILSSYLFIMLFYIICLNYPSFDDILFIISIFITLVSFMNVRFKILVCGLSRFFIICAILSIGRGRLRFGLFVFCLRVLSSSSCRVFIFIALSLRSNIGLFRLHCL